MIESFIGKKFGKWTVLEFSGRDKHRKSLWKCKCLCGEIQNKSRNILVTGRSTQCRKCKDKKQIINLVGKRFGKWTVVKQAQNDQKNNCLMWECFCECGVRSKVRGKCLLSGGSTQCRACKDKSMISEEIVPAFMFNRIKQGSQKRGIDFSISKKYIEKKLIEQNKECALSGLPIEIRSIDGYKASLDRIDSSKGYVEGNVQWVVQEINFMKQSLSENDFVNLCKKVSENH
jgi:hypothetical protein